MRKWLVLATLLLVGSTSAHAGDFCTTPYPPGGGWSISFGGVFDWGTIGITLGEDFHGSNWSVSYEYPGYRGCDDLVYGYYGYYPGYGDWIYPDRCDWPTYPYYSSYSYGYGYYYPGYAGSAYTYCPPTYSSSPRDCSSYPVYGGGYYHSRPRYPVDGRHDSHDRGGSRGYTSAPPPTRYSGERSWPSPTPRYAERDRGQQVYWNSRTSIGGSPSTGERPYRVPPTERTASAARGGDRGSRYGR